MALPAINFCRQIAGKFHVYMPVIKKRKEDMSLQCSNRFRRTIFSNFKTFPALIISKYGSNIYQKMPQFLNNLTNDLNLFFIALTENIKKLQIRLSQPLKLSNTDTPVASWRSRNISKEKSPYLSMCLAAQVMTSPRFDRACGNGNARKPR